MPSNLAAATVSPTSTVFPKSLCYAYSESMSYPMLATSYHDGTVERSLVQDGVNPPRPARVWRMSKRLTTSQLATLLTFWETTVMGGHKPFYFYDPFDPATGQPVGSNHDPTGASTQGRVTVTFKGGWGQVTQLGRHEVGGLELVEAT